MEIFSAMNPSRKKPRLPEYRFQNAPQGDSTWVEITSGEYSGVIYSYGTVKFSDEFDMPKLKFNFAVLYSGNHSASDLQTDQNFITIIGDILTDIIINNEPTRNDNSQESDLY